MERLPHLGVVVPFDRDGGGGQLPGSLCLRAALLAVDSGSAEAAPSRARAMGARR